MDNNAKQNIPDLSVVIVNWNTCAELRACLKAVEASTLDSKELIIIDNASSDNSVKMAGEEFPNVNLIENDKNLGFAKASNQGIAVSKGKYILLLNPDTEVRPETFSKMIEFADKNPEYGIIGPKILNSDGTLYWSCRGFPTLMAGLFRNTILGHFFPKNTYLRDYLMVEWDHTEPREVDWVSGAALLIRRELIEDIGTLDERFFMYCEDVDIAYRAHSEGWKVAYYPNAEIIHARGKSSDKALNRMIIEHHKSMYKFYRKHYTKEYSIFVWALVPLGLIARASFFVLRNHRNYIMSKLRGKHRKSSDETSSRGECGETQEP